MAQDDEFGRHECLDRTSLIMNLLDLELVHHKGLKEDELELARMAYTHLYNLYQLIGEREL